MPRPDRGDDAVTVGDLAGQHAAGAKTQHHHGEGQRRGAPGHAEIGLHHRQHDHDRPHPDAAERADQDRDRKPGPCPARIGNEQFGISGEWSRNIHGGRNLSAPRPLGQPPRRDIGQNFAAHHVDGRVRSGDFRAAMPLPELACSEFRTLPAERGEVKTAARAISPLPVLGERSGEGRPRYAHRRHGFAATPALTLC